MKNHSKKTTHKISRFNMPSLYRVNKAQASHLRYDHLQGRQPAGQPQKPVKGV